MSALALRDPHPAAWHEARLSGLGSSDCPVVLGLSRFSTPAQLWAAKLGRLANEPPSPLMRLGQLMEPLLAQLYREETGRPLRREGRLRRHHLRAARPELVILYAHLDAMTESAGRPLPVEIKWSPYRGDWGSAGTDEVPDDVGAQVQHQLAVTGAPEADVAALVGTDFRVYRVPRDPLLIEIIETRLVAWWHDYVEAEVEPPVTAADADYVRRSHPADNGAELVATAADGLLLADYRRARAEADEAERAADELQVRLKARIGDFAMLRGPGFAVSWRSYSRSSTAWKAVAEEAAVAAEIIERHTTTTPYRRFAVRAEEER